MNPPSHDDRLRRLFAVARQAPVSAAGQPPPGFATRVAAEWSARRAMPAPDLLAILGLRGLAVAALLAVAAGALHYGPFLELLHQQQSVELDPLAEVLGDL